MSTDRLRAPLVAIASACVAVTCVVARDQSPADPRPAGDPPDGLDGRFDVEYSCSPQPPTPGAESVFGPDAPAISVALEEQLGLQIESRRMSVPVLVIDTIERPSEN